VRAEIDSSSVAEFNELPKRIEAASFSKTSGRMGEYQEKEASVRLSEDRAVEFMSKLTAKWRETESHLDYLSNEFHNAAELRSEIDEWSQKLGQLKIEVMKFGESEADARRKLAYLRNLKTTIQQRQRENEEHMKAASDHEVLLGKKAKQLKRRREKMAQTEQWMIATEKAKAQKDVDVGKMERDVLELQIRLNEKLLEGQALSTRLQPLELIDGKTPTDVRIEEMTKVMELVAIDRTEAV
jgi:chromosome segregation ATPase